MTQTSLSETEDSLKLVTLARSTIVALVIQVIGLIVTYLAQVFLARWMGKTEYGIYEYVVTWSLLLAIPTGLGLPRAVVRFISEYRVKKEWGYLRGIIIKSWQLTIAMGLLICIIGIGIIFGINYYHKFDYASIFLVGMWLVPLQALIILQEDMSRGAETITLAYGPSKVLWPMLLIISGFFLFQQQHFLTSIEITRITIATLLTVVVLQLFLLWQKFDREIEPANPTYATREWLIVALPLLLHRTFRELLTQTDILMLGSIIGAEAVGIYSPAAKTSLWVSFVLKTINIVVAPAFVILHTKSDRQGLQKLISLVSIWIFIPSLIIAVGLMIFSETILGMFGSEFIGAGWELKILVIGQLVNALCGSVGVLLTMTGYQNQVLLVSGCTALINLVLNAIAIPFLGTVGAAMTTAFTLIVWNIWMAVLVVKNLQIDPSIFSVIRKNQ